MRVLDWLLLGLGRVLYFVGAAGLVRRLRRGPRVLLYHAVEPVERAHLRGLDSNTPPEIFERHLDYLARHHPVVALAEYESGRLPAQAVLITFDDGYRSVLAEALPRLQQRKMPAVLYVVSDAVGNERPVWVNELAWRLNQSAAARAAAASRLGAPAEASAGDLVASAVAAFEPGATRELLAAVQAASPELDCDRAMRDEAWYITWDEARHLSAAGIAIGNHTATHPVLARLGADQQQAEMEQGRERVARELGACTSLAYPFGSYNEASPSAARMAGHASVMLVGERLATGPMAQGRVPVTGTSDAALFAELEVVAPVKAALRRLIRGPG